ncbi:unnamed protein product [Cladocopium goreaui]|uniref:FPL domain-containing protein n=1 Tax=Cladocopium goreaui TaxID=2562237 RepID=A0A9P1D789_9DINO|nr:unnamed protein product [Cladocopium goreaui]
MEGLLSFLKLPLSYGHEAFKQHWPHTPHEANLVVERLHDLARALLFGARKDDAIVASFLEKRGLSILLEALLAVATPEMIRTQAWQSLSVILLNVKEDALQRLIRGRELDLLWSGEPDLRTEELGSCASCAPCGVKQVLSQWLNPSDPQQRLQGKSSLIFSLLYIHSILAN